MQNFYPQLRSTENPFEHQITYSSDEGEENDSCFQEFQSESGSEKVGVAESGKALPLRAATAPARPSSEKEEFRRSSDYWTVSMTLSP